MEFVFWCQKIKINRTYVFWCDIKCTRTENVKNFWRVNATPRLTNTGLILGNMQKIHVKPIVLYSGRWTRNGDSRVFIFRKKRKIFFFLFCIITTVMMWVSSYLIDCYIKQLHIEYFLFEPNTQINSVYYIPSVLYHTFPLSKRFTFQSHI